MAAEPKDYICKCWFLVQEQEEGQGILGLSYWNNNSNAMDGKWEQGAFFHFCAKLGANCDTNYASLIIIE